MRYAYYPGCASLGWSREVDTATRLVCARLGIDLVGLPAAPCCGAGEVQQVARTAGAALGALTLSQAGQLGLDVMTACSVCMLSLRQSRALLEGPERVAERQRVGAALAAGGWRYVGTHAQVTHLLWVLWRHVGVDGLAAAVTRRLSGVNVAAFYGCQVLRPSTLNPEDDADTPVSLEELAMACGARVVDYDGRLSCCGWPLAASRRGASDALATRAVVAAATAGAHVIVTPCPHCRTSLESCQQGTNLGVPVLHLSQFVGLALGISSRESLPGWYVANGGPLAARLGLDFV